MIYWSVIKLKAADRSSLSERMRYTLDAIDSNFISTGILYSQLNKYTGFSFGSYPPAARAGSLPSLFMPLFLITKTSMLYTS